MDRLRQLGILLLCARVAAIPLIFDVNSLVVFSVPKAYAAYCLSALLFGALVAFIVRDGLRAIPRTVLHVPVVVFAAAYVIASATALNPTVAILGSPDRALGLLTVLDSLILYVSLVTFPRTRGDAMLIGGSAIAPVPLVVLYEVIQWAGLDPMPWASGLVRTRPFSTFGNAGVLAVYLGPLSVAAGVLLFERSLTRVQRVVLGACCTFAFAGALLTVARAVIVGYALVAAAALLLLLIRVPSARLRLMLTAGLGSMLIAGSALLAVGPLGQRLEGVLTSVQELATTGTARDGSVSGRVILYEVALREFSARPLFGVGPDNFTVAFPQYRPANALASFGSTAIETSPHSWVFHVLTDAGLSALVAYVATYVIALVLVLRRRSALVLASVGLMTAFLGTGFFSVSDPGTDWLFWLGAGIIGAVTSRAQATDVGRSVSRVPRRSPLRSVVPIAALVCSVAIALVPIGWIQGAQAAELSRRARALNQLPEAVLAARVAVARDPWRAEYWHALGLSLGRSGDVRGAIIAFQRAVTLASYHTTYQTNLARSYITAGLQSDRTLMQQGVQHAQQAVESDPNNPDPHFTLALALQAAGRPQDAVLESEIGFALQPAPPDPLNYDVVGRAYLDSGRPVEAERWLRLGLERGAGDSSVSIRLQLARSLAVQQRVQEALAVVDSVLASDPNNAAAQRFRNELQSR